MRAALLPRVRVVLAAAGAWQLDRVINATGVVLHTNLGRAPLGPAALARLAVVAAGYSNLELDVRAKTRGSRYEHVDRLLCQLSGAEASSWSTTTRRRFCSPSRRSPAGGRSWCRGAS